ncbi:hypothetical protein GOB86_03320 [Acetobacter lambici]|uniref:Uncharacterized protein n=1 Tax=Acetobacter lambici TaxID=1332824 RepID=A0ABT1F615_9PROT|nr:hypothetical protein [Acetobacter lambici]MCP1243098.1 hypothetical protein [Acetobacter lambici]MCP1259184.1 hypothetical protein [Acetobacter lambici]NHO56111.1 hypothetical protein [Acetobacter lambici]
MRKETAFIIGFLVLTISTTVVIWTFALPNFKPVSFPQIASGVIDVGPMHHQRPLEADEVVDVNKWLSTHKSGWGPLSRTPPSSGDSHLLLKDAQGKDVLTLTLWTGISAADWNATVFVESPDGSWVRSETFPNKEFAPLRMMVDRYPFKHSSFP